MYFIHSFYMNKLNDDLTTDPKRKRGEPSEAIPRIEKETANSNGRSSSGDLDHGNNALHGNELSNEEILRRLDSKLIEESNQIDALTSVSRIRTKAIVEILEQNPDNFRIQLLCIIFDDFLTNQPKRSGRTTAIVEHVENFLRAVTKYDNFEDAKDDLEFNGVSTYRIDDEIHVLQVMKQKYERELLPTFLKRPENRQLALKYLNEADHKPIGSKIQQKKGLPNFEQR